VRGSRNRSGATSAPRAIPFRGLRVEDGADSGPKWTVRQGPRMPEGGEAYDADPRCRHRQVIWADARVRAKRGVGRIG
jgi:hypothetical protein